MLGNHCGILPIHCIQYICLHWQDKQRKMHEEQRELIQQQAQAKAQVMRYENDLAKKRMQVQTAK